MIRKCLAAAIICAALSVSAPVLAQEATKPTANAEAMAKLNGMKGVWRGTAAGMSANGPFTVTQTERIGNMLGGDLIVIEGRGYKPDGSVAFNAFGVISYDAPTGKYEFRAYNAGHGGTFPFTLTDTGGVWEFPVGPAAKIVSTITLTPTTWHEVQQYVADGKPPVQTMEMTLQRVSDTDWPGANPVPPQ